VHNSAQFGAGDMKKQRGDEAALPVPPDGGYGWIVMLGSFGIHIVVDGIAFSFGVLYDEFLDYFGDSRGNTSFVGSVLSGVYLMSGKCSHAFSPPRLVQFNWFINFSVQYKECTHINKTWMHNADIDQLID